MRQILALCPQEIKRYVPEARALSRPRSTCLVPRRAVASVADPRRQPVHRAVEDAERFQVLFHREEILPVGAELAFRPRDAPDDLLFRELAGITRMCPVHDEGDDALRSHPRP